jgi:hypothetical protein
MEEVSQKRKVVVFIVVALMFSTAVTYFVAASKESSELQESQPSSALETRKEGTSTTEQEEQEEQEQSSVASKISGPRNESIFFYIVAFAYIGVGIWILKNRNTINKRAPYMIAIIGSIVLIAFYTATRIVEIPYIGIEEEINSIDILAKCLQVGIIAGSIYVLVTSRKTKQKQIQQNS